MELKDFISETIVQIATGVTDAIEKCSEKNVIVNPDITIGENGEFWVPSKGSYRISRRVQQVEMDVCVTVSESENNGIDAKVRISVFGIEANSTGIKSNTNETRIRFSIPVCLPVSKVNLSEK